MDIDIKKLSPPDVLNPAYLQQLEKRDKVLSKCVENSANAVYISDYETGKIIIANQALCRLLDLRRSEIVGRKCRDLLDSIIGGFCDLCPHAHLFDKHNEPTGSHTREFFYSEKGLWLRITGLAAAWGNGQRAKIMTIEDVTQEHAMRRQLEKLAYYDNLTGLPNVNKLALDFRSGGQQGFPDNYLICFDLCSLRLFIDAYGKDVGNEMLRAIMGWFKSKFPDRERMYLLESFEFCLLLEKEAGADRARGLAQEVLERFEKPWRVVIDGHEISYVCGVSVSILHIPDETNRLQDLQSLISRTLNSGRKTASGIFVYDEEKDRENREHIKLVLSLKECVTQGMQGFSLNYQPIVKLSSGLWAGVEALCRWNRPGGGPVSPLVFIHEAESLGLINELGVWILETAVRQAKELGLDKLEDFFLSVNISPIQMMDDSFADTVANILKTYHYPGDKLNLEITESAHVTFTPFTMAMISELRGMGISLALDDFGTGYSTFSSLKNLPVSFLKTEREFITGIEHDNYMQYFFFILAEIAHAAKMKLIAEGIETAEQLKIAKNNGADYIQGYFFSKPLPARELAEKYERFVVPDHSYIPETADVVNIQRWLSGKNAYEITPALFSLMNQCMQIMLSETDVTRSFQGIFEIVGDHFGVSRAFSFVQEEKPGMYSNLFEWCSERVAAQKHLLQKVPVMLTTPSLYRSFKEDGLLNCSSVEELSPDMRAALQGQDVMAVLLIPMWDETELLGFVGFDKTMAHVWSPEEIVMLWNVAILMANTIKREKLKPELVEQKSLLDSVLQNSGINAYVADLDTHDLLWMNEAMRQARNLPDGAVGRKCYQVLAEAGEPCAGCLMPGPGAGRENDARPAEPGGCFIGKDCMEYGGLVQWGGKNNAFIHYFVEASEPKDTEKQLVHLACTDMLTGAYNRAATINLMQDLLHETHAGNGILSLCHVKLNQLKEINARHGRDLGDQALFHMVQSIRGIVHRCDVIGRLLGDDFIILMPGCARGLAKVRMVQARNALAEIKLLPEPETLSFSFGVTDSAELSYAENAAYYGKLLAMAERRMLEQRHHEARVA